MYYSCTKKDRLQIDYSLDNVREINFLIGVFPSNSDLFLKFGWLGVVGIQNGKAINDLLIILLCYIA